MPVLGCRMVLSILLFFLNCRPCVGLVVSTRTRIRREKRSQFRAEATNGSENISRTESTVSSQTPDFPDFAYNIARNEDSTDLLTPISVRHQLDGETFEYMTDVPSGDPSVVGKSSSPLFAFFESSLEELGPRTLLRMSARSTRLRKERSYARNEPFERNLQVPPSFCDLTTPPCSRSEAFWISSPARILSFTVAYCVFPMIAMFVDSFATMPPDQLDEITVKFGPGISILYGTFISLTLSILYNRQRVIQDNVSVECSYLGYLTRNLLSLGRDHQWFVEAVGQCAADQVRVLVTESRGTELLKIMYSDPYCRFRELLDEYERKYGNNSSLIGNSRDLLKDMFRIRANRLSDESLALPPTHFFILNFLTVLILLGYTVSIIPTVDLYGTPSNESCLLFAVLSTIYILFYNFASDLNNPFSGVYQIRRSCAASHLLQLKFLLTNHPILRGKIQVIPSEQQDSVNHVTSVLTPDLGQFWFQEGESSTS